MNFSSLNSVLSGRTSRKRANPIITVGLDDFPFEGNTELFCYSKDTIERKSIENVKEISFKSGQVNWLNVFGLSHNKEFQEIVELNKLDPFLLQLFGDTQHRTKVVQLDGGFFFTAKSIEANSSNSVVLEQMMFVVTENMVWSLQEIIGDDFDHIRSRLMENHGRVRGEGADYLLFLLLEIIVENYYITYHNLSEKFKKILEKSVNPMPDQLEQIEWNKTQLFRIRRSLGNLKEAISLIMVLDESLIKSKNHKYFTELKEQSAYLCDLLDNDLTRLESASNLFFSLQSHKLNEVMKTLTILSAIFIPLTFIAGIYGMNFDNMPELRTQNGYFIVLVFMLTVATGSMVYFRRKRWF